VADVSGSHPDLGPELRALAQTILDKIDPALRTAAALAAARAAGSSGGPGACQQVWCPVCALAAVLSGEEHPLVTVISEHSVALLAVIRALIEPTAEGTDPTSPPNGPGPEAPPPGGDAAAPGASRYEPIPVTVED
jgi:hypothetical protein